MENEILVGDCAETLKSLPSESIDCIITDPPYGYKFMNVSWDRALPSLEALKECCRVLKSGAFAFFMSAPRQDVLSRMIIRLEEAGFQTGFTSIYWAYASGFPKAATVDKLIDKRAGRLHCSVDVIKDEIRNRYEKAGMTLKEFNAACGFEASGYLRKSSTWATVLPDREKWAIIKKVINCDNEIDNDLDKLFEEAEREIIGEKPYTSHCGAFIPNADDVGRVQLYETAPATEQAKRFEGSFAGFQPKPAVEVIIVCMKPLNQKTYVDQALKNGKGVTWLGDCRIPGEAPHHNEAGRMSGDGWTEKGGSVYYADPDGRFPANLLVSDDMLNDGLNHKSGAMDCIAKNEHDKTVCYGEFKPFQRHAIKSEGSFSRYFDLDAWFKLKLPEQAQKTYPYLIVAKPSKSEKNKYCENKHPTVKPLKLMSYLITMGSREGDLILDPFAGSGTTLEAARLLNRKFVGCELTEEYLNVLEARAGVKASQCPYRNIIEICEPVKSIEDLEKLMSQEEQNSYYNLLLGVPFEFFDMVRKAYWIDKGMVV